MARSICTIEGCDRPVNGHGLCYHHYERIRDAKDPVPPGFNPPWKPCTVAGCERWARSRGLCSKHYAHWTYHDNPNAEIRQCAICGKDFKYMPSGPSYKGLYCGRTCANKAAKGGRGRRGPDNPNWKGGRHVRKRDGYATIKIDGKQILEHRYVMEQHLGRALLPNETVHHLNGVKDDNRLENLELWTGNHGKGVRHHEAEAHCATCTCFDH